MMSVVLFLRRCEQRFLDATTDHVQGRARGDDEETSERVVTFRLCVSQGKSHQQIKREAGAKLKNWWLTDIEKVLVEGERLNPATKHLLPFECFHEVGQNVKAASSIGAINVAFFFFLSVFPAAACPEPVLTSHRLFLLYSNCQNAGLVLCRRNPAFADQPLRAGGLAGAAARAETSLGGEP